MLFSVTWEFIDASEAGIRRSLECFEKWQPPDGAEFKGFFGFTDGTGGVALTWWTAPNAGAVDRPLDAVAPVHRQAHPAHRNLLCHRRRGRGVPASVDFGADVESGR